MERVFDKEILNLNPVRRVRRGLELSLHEVSEKAKVNFQTWYLTERGCYAQVPIAIESFIESEVGYNRLLLEDQYLDFVHLNRVMFKEFYQNLYSLLDVVDSLVDVYEGLGLTRTQFAKLLCVQPAVLYKFESGRQKTLPKQLREAMEEAGFSVGLILKLQERKVLNGK